MSALETIRKRAKLLVIIIGASLLIFVLEDALTSGRFFFGGGDNTIAIINGKKIDYTKFRVDADNAIEKEKTSLGVESLRDSDETEVVQGAFKTMVFQMLLDPQYQKLGVNVPDSELTNLMIGSHPASDVYRYFAGISKQFFDPRTGALSQAMVIRYLKQMPAQDQARWELLEDRIKNEDLQEKYFYLVVKGLFIPDAIAKLDNEDATKTYNISYVLKRYTDVPDNSVTASDQDLKDYYNKHLYEYYQDEETRKVDYVTFAVNPTDSDMMNIHTAVDTMYNQFKNCAKVSDDSTFIVSTDAQVFDYQFYKAEDLPASIDSAMTLAEVGGMYGPYKKDNKYKIAKLLDVADLPDSIRVSRIVIQVQNSADMEKLKPFVDSLKSIATVDNFGDLVKANSKDPDPEIAQKSGDMGWMVRGKQKDFPPFLEHEVFFGKVGNVIELPVQAGYLILCVMDQSEKHKNYQVGIAAKNIEPSTATQQKVYADANAFEIKGNTSDTYEKAAAQMNRRVVDINENETSLEGIQTPKELIRWAYDKKEGDVSDVITAGENKYVVAHIIKIVKMGTIPLEQVKDEVKQKVLNEKKAEKMVADMKSALTGGATLASVAKKMGGHSDTAKGLTFDSYSIPTLGKEDKVIGTMSALNTGALSQPIQGELGVYVIRVDSTYYTNKSDYRLTQMREIEDLRDRAPNEAYNALLKKAGFVSHLGKYY